MQIRLSVQIQISLVLVTFFWASASNAQNSEASELSEHYIMGKQTRDGIGKYYMGREISQVMGHLGAGWLERPKREQEERTDLLVKNMNLKETDFVADIGAGSGYFSFRISPLVPKGKVFAVDISPQMLGIMRAKKQQGNFNNVITVQSTIMDTALKKDSIDCALIVDAYHEFSHPREMSLSLFNALKKKGRLILIEYRKEDPNVPIKLLHKMSEKQAIKEISSVGFKWVKTLNFLPRQHFMIFEKPSSND